MAITQESTVNQIEITEDGTVQVRLAIRVLNGEKVVSSRWHRTSFDMTMEDAVALQMASVNEHLEMMGEAPVLQAEIDRIHSFYLLAKEHLE